MNLHYETVSPLLKETLQKLVNSPIFKDLKTLGRKRICQIHISETDGVTLPHSKNIDMHRVKEQLDKMGWSGWLVVERSRDAGDVRNVKKNFGMNIRYLKEVFQDAK